MCQFSNYAQNIYSRSGCNKYNFKFVGRQEDITESPDDRKQHTTKLVRILSEVCSASIMLLSALRKFLCAFIEFCKRTENILATAVGFILMGAM